MSLANRQSTVRKHRRSAREDRTGPRRSCCRLHSLRHRCRTHSTDWAVVGCHMANCAVRPLIVVSLQGRGGCEARHALVGCCIRTDGRELTPRGRADQGPGHLDTDKHLMIVENALC